MRHISLFIANKDMQTQNTYIVCFIDFVFLFIHTLLLGFWAAFKKAALQKQQGAKKAE